MRDYTYKHHTIPTLSFTNFMRINRQLSMLIQSLSSLGDRVSADQFLVIVKLMQQKPKAIQFGRLSYIQALSTSGGGHPSTLAGISPQYLSITDNHPLFIAMANKYAYFMGDISRWEDVTKAIWESHDMCPLLTQFQVSEIAWLGLSTISQAEVWEDPKSPRFGMAYLLLVPAQEVKEERRFGLVVVWVHPSQTLLPSLEEVAMKLILLINMKED